MTIQHHEDTFWGRPIREYTPTSGITDPSQFAYRFSIDPEEDASAVSPPSKGFFGLFKGKPSETEKPPKLSSKFGKLLEDPLSSQLEALVFGMCEEDWGGDEGFERIITLLSQYRENFPALKALFLGDITYEECEMSWIKQSDITPVLRGYPDLECLRTRGMDGLDLKPASHAKLKTLIIETGGLDSSIVEAISQSQFPDLEHLELWLGDSGYGANVTVEHLEPILSGRLFPKLSTLGLCDSEIADDLAKAVVTSPIISQISTLDLSLGTLSDEGAGALLVLGDRKLAPRVFCRILALGGIDVPQLLHLLYHGG